MIGNVAQSGTPAATTSVQSAGVSGLSPEERLLSLMVYCDITKSNAAEAAVELSAEKVEQLREELRQAIEAAHEAQEDAGFWEKLSSVLSGDVAAIAQLVAIAALAVATGGTAAMVLGAIAIGATLGARYGKELGLPDEVAIGLSVAAALATMSMGFCGGGLSELTSLASAAKSTGLIAQGVAVGAQGGGAVAKKTAKDCEAEALEHRADARSIETAQELEQSTIDENLRRIERFLELQGSSVERGSAMLQNTNQSTHFVLQNFAGLA